MPISKLDASLVSLLSVIESSYDEQEREAAVHAVAEQGGADACRVLIEVYQRSMWRSTRMATLRALGRLAHPRALEFLLHLSSQPEDLAMAAEAVVALGQTHSPVAGERLLVILEEPEHPLRREAVMALSGMAFFPYEESLARLLEDGENLPPTLLQYVLLGLSRRNHPGLWPKLAERLGRAQSDHQRLVFNAALLGAGEVGGEEALGFLQGLDTRYRFFAHELKRLAQERIERRLGLGLEDVVAEVLRRPDRISERVALRRFPLAQAWEAWELLGAGAPVEVECHVRVLLFEASRQARDMEFLVSNLPGLDFDLAAALVCLHGRKAPDFFEQLYQRIGRGPGAELMARVREPAALARLELRIEDASGSVSVRIQELNALVSQALMAGAGRDTLADAAARLLRLGEKLPNGPVRQRAVRALGQLQWPDKRAANAVEKWLRKDATSYPSSFAALSGVPHPEASEVVVRHLKRRQEQWVQAPDELTQALAALARMSEHGDLSGLEGLELVSHLGTPERRRLALLLLTKTCLPSWAELIEAGLGAQDYETQMLALAAAKRHPTRQIVERTFPLLDSPHASLRERALDALASSGTYRDHERVLAWLGEALPQRHAALKFFRSLVPEKGQDYRRLAQGLDRRLETKTGLFADTEVAEAAQALSDQLMFTVLTGPSTPGAEARSVDRTLYEVDQVLGEVLPGFRGYSEVVKSALRNAELTCRNPELFGERVDKSTVVVEFVKAIDLLLQERLGSQIFVGRNSALLAAMQSRVVQLQLHDDTISTYEWVKDLGCERHFEPDRFPSHKMVALARSILSGKISHDAHRTIDGPRAWALILLLFARTFSFRSLSLAPLLRMRESSGAVVGDLAARLDDLQGQRNLAAHRGTLLRADEVDTLRARSFGVLVDLTRALP